MLKTSLSVTQALARLLATIHPLQKEQVPLIDCLGRVLAQDVIAEIDLPPFSNSAMDGYAVRSADVIHASAERPVTLTVVWEDAVEYEALPMLGPGEAVPIMTGGPLPPGSDA
ncbi:MAG: molybdopterin molybdenumtransferase MoeA, partial [Anaerolineales bacterium]|nr:molybdopterin molybdenumtransferase MoeA [Anaerolineales bacterium]